MQPQALIMHHLFLFLFFILILIQSAASTVPSTLVEHLDPTLPPVHVGQKPKCSVLALQYDFGHTVGLPPATANYTHPTDCPGPWSRVVLELSASASGPQKSRIAAVWVDGVELLRTATPLSTAAGTFWNVQKDVTRYNAALRRLASGDGSLSMMLENSNVTLPGVYAVNLTLHFYRGGRGIRSFGQPAFPAVKGLYRHPAHYIIPISDRTGFCSGGYWFRVENGSHVPSTNVVVPRNAYRAVMEIFASYHDDDEVWYAKPIMSSYDASTGLGSSRRSNGGFRQVYATIDGKFAGGHIPFPVVYPGSVNPYFWKPVAAIGAFDMPSYSVDVTPFLGVLLDGKEHEIGIGVRDAGSHWLVTGNLHVWVDMWSDEVEAGMLWYSAPPLKLNRHAEWNEGDGRSEIDGEGLVKFVGWVSSAMGNITTTVRQKVRFTTQVAMQNRGTVTQVDMMSKQRMTVGEVTGNHIILSRVQLMTEAPLQIQSSAEAASGARAAIQRTKMYHQLDETLNLNDNYVVTTSSMTDRQDAEGSALIQDGFPVWGIGSTKSFYQYRDQNECYLRTLNAEGGMVKDDATSASCLGVAES